MKLRLRSKTIRRFLFILLCLVASGLADGQGLSVSGRVIDGEGHPVAGATVMVKGSHSGTITDAQGRFHLKGEKQGVSLLISSIGFEKQEVKATERKGLTVTLTRSTNQLDQTVIRAYGTTTRRLNTGDISTVTAREIGQQPVSNPLAALEGRVPGLVVTQTSGVPGAAFKVQIMGQNSIAQGSEPLFIIDGVPFAPNNNSVNQLSSAVGANGLSPFNSIDPSNIASIEILKDADATAIYGSRGANGVVLITTKQGMAGKAKLNLNVSEGFSRTATSLKMLDTRHYLTMRREAFKNDNVTPDVSNAPDLLSWDTTRYTDLRKLLTGGTAHSTNANASISGGNQQTRFLISGGLHRETTVFPGDMADNRYSVHFNLNHISVNRRFRLNLTSGYISDNNNIIETDLTGRLTLPPDLPELFDSSGNLNWQHNGESFDNPLSYLFDKYEDHDDNLIGNMSLSYVFAKGLEFKLKIGYNSMVIGEQSVYPSIAQNPLYNPSSSAQFAHSQLKSWIAEPQITYKKRIGKGVINLLAGTSWQQVTNGGNVILASGYSSDQLLQSPGAASNISVNSNYNQYRYEGVFGRVNYNWKDKYIVNVSGRRDGSSRFGPGYRFANFGAVGAAWIFSDEPFFTSLLPFVSYGKLRASYGSTGNDQIGNYEYLDTWSATREPYHGQSGLYPTRLFNRDYRWEINRKLEGEVDLGFLNDRIVFSGTYFRNRSSNELIDYSLPVQTGFTGIIRNLPALLQNTGFELSLSAQFFSHSRFHWTTRVNITLPHNKLIAFPNLDESSYAHTYVIGQSLSVINRAKLTGVDPATGVFQIGDANKDGSIDFNDYRVTGNLDPKVYGGWSNGLSYKQWELDVFFEFRKQRGTNYWATLDNLVPGTMVNQPSVVLKRWRKTGDKTDVPRFTQDPGSDAYHNLTSLLPMSDGIYGDASYLRLKNVALYFNVPPEWSGKLHLEHVRIYLLGENLLTFTPYEVSDPETQSLYTLPPLKTATIGIQFNF